MRIEPGFDLGVAREERATVMADMTIMKFRHREALLTSSIAHLYEIFMRRAANLPTS